MHYKRKAIHTIFTDKGQMGQIINNMLTDPPFKNVQIKDN